MSPETIFREIPTSVTANLSASSAPPRPEPRVDLAAARLLAPLPSAWLAGLDLDLLAPLKFLPPGRLPAFTPPAPPTMDRRELAEALAVSNRAYGNENADRLARRLADAAGRAVVAGPPPGP